MTTSLLPIVFLPHFPVPLFLSPFNFSPCLCSLCVRVYFLFPFLVSRVFPVFFSVFCFPRFGSPFSSFLTRMFLSFLTFVQFLFPFSFPVFCVPFFTLFIVFGLLFSRCLPDVVFPFFVFSGLFYQFLISRCFSPFLPPVVFSFICSFFFFVFSLSSCCV